jgi:hypothetical protein
VSEQQVSGADISALYSYTSELISAKKARLVALDARDLHRRAGCSNKADQTESSIQAASLLELDDHLHDTDQVSE